MYLCTNILYFVVADITKVVYANGITRSGLPSSQYKSSISVVPNVSYSVTIEVLITSKMSVYESLTEVVLDGKDLGSCSPEANTASCAFSICQEISKKEVIVVSKSGTMDLSMTFFNHSSRCNCDPISWKCSPKFTDSGQISMVAVARIGLRRISEFDTGMIR